MSKLDDLKKAQELLGLYKAEWLNKDIFEYFSEPGYFDSLKTSRPCVLIGGRGTGKTTVLKGLSYEGQFALTEKGKDKSIDEWSFYGMYYRVNTNRVTAFKGSELSEELWVKYFSHYINLIFCLELLKFCEWYEQIASTKITLNNKQWRKILASWRLSQEINDIDQLHEEIEILLIEFENALNSDIEEGRKLLTLLGVPIDILAKEILSVQNLKGKQFYFIIDEFENFEDYQQKILNTMIKHGNDYYTFKIGVRELGYRQKETLNANEHLRSPADYEKIDLNEIFSDNFKGFATNVINSRLNQHYKSDSTFQISNILKSLSSSEEAELLIGKDTKSLIEFEQLLSNEDKKIYNSASIPHKYFIKYLSQNDKLNISKLLLSFENNDAAWKNKLNNYFYASLFAIKQGKPGIRKYYCGWDTYVAMSGNNIRYLLELVNTTLQEFLSDTAKDSSYDERTDIQISPSQQTNAAIKVGKKNLSEIEGLTVEGAKLKKLLLSLGRVFQVFASQSSGHAPELNQFEISKEHDDPALFEKVDKLLTQSVMHLALTRSIGSKLQAETSIRDYDFMIHPIYSAFFVISYRKKRKMSLSSSSFVQLVESPTEGIKKILNQNNRTEDESSMPDQLQLFGEFYG